MFRSNPARLRYHLCAFLMAANPGPSLRMLHGSAFLCIWVSCGVWLLGCEINTPLPLLDPVGVRRASVSGVWCDFVDGVCTGIGWVMYDAPGSVCIRVIKLRKRKAGPVRIFDQKPLLIRRGTSSLLTFPPGLFSEIVVGNLGLIKGGKGLWGSLGR